MISGVGYHGTNVKFSEFKCPAYFAETFETADFFAKRAGGDNGFVIQCNITFSNPLVVDLCGQSWGGFHLQDSSLERNCIKYISFGNMDEEAYFEREGLTIDFLAEYAESLGYDGVVAKGCLEEGGSIETQYVALSPSSISIIKDMEGVAC